MANKRSEDIYRTEFVQGHVDRALRELSAYYRGVMDAMVPTQPFDSPLEATFYVWWIALSSLVPDCAVGLAPQIEVDIAGERFRLDFAVLPYGEISPDDPHPIKVAVELDGHDFHERTKEQVERRNYRDRRLLEAGWEVLHFAGSEVNRDPLGCVQAVYRAGVRAHRKAKA